MQVPGERFDEESEKGGATRQSNDGRGEDAAAVRVVDEVPTPPEERITTGKGGTSDELIIAMEAMEVGEEEMAEGDELTADKGGAEAGGEGG